MSNKNQQTSNEPIQRYYKQQHSKMKNRLIGKGGNKTPGFPGAEKPDMERAKSAPPGFGAGVMEELAEKMPHASVVLLFNPDYKCLFVKRAPGKYWGSEQWANIGGHMEEGESANECAIREVYEETRIDIEKERLYYLRPERNAYIFYCFLNYTPEPILNPEHTDWAWVSPQNLSNYNLVEGAEQLVEECLGEPFSSALYEEETNETPVISFDFDGTLTKFREVPFIKTGIPSIEIGLNEEMAQLLKDYVKNGAKVLITTAREKTKEDVEDIKAFIKHFRLPVQKIVFTNLQPKSSFLLARSVSHHYDDKENVINDIMENTPSIGTTLVTPVE